MTAGITLSGAITALVAEKRAVGCKYHAEQQVLARFETFSSSEFPGCCRPRCLHMVRLRSVCMVRLAGDGVWLWQHAAPWRRVGCSGGRVVRVSRWRG
jgi:hypothetical protein